MDALADVSETARTIDWSALGPGAPIPASMPTASSDDPLEAGFSREWARRALKGAGVAADSAERQRRAARARADPVALALAIISRRRAPDDQWAHELERRLRELVRTEIDSQGATVSRVFCNAAGCLCYTERDGADANEAGFSAMFDTLTDKGGWADRSGIDPRAVYRVTGAGYADIPDKAVWQLVLLMRLPLGTEGLPTGE